MEHKAGFVNIIGNPNVGKSTLMNVLMGEKISIITHKAQTTRHRILGILNEEDYQIVARKEVRTTQSHPFASTTVQIYVPGYKRT